MYFYIYKFSTFLTIGAFSDKKSPHNTAFFLNHTHHKGAFSSYTGHDLFISKTTSHYFIDIAKPPEGAIRSFSFVFEVTFFSTISYLEQASDPVS